MGDLVTPERGPLIRLAIAMAVEGGMGPSKPMTDWVERWKAPISDGWIASTYGRHPEGNFVTLSHHLEGGGIRRVTYFEGTGELKSMGAPTDEMRRISGSVWARLMASDKESNVADSDYSIVDYLTEHYPEILTVENLPEDEEELGEWLHDTYYERELEVHTRAGEDVFPDPEKAAQESLASVERAIRANRAQINAWRE